jgi:putative membrane protein
MKLLIRWLVNALSLLIVAHVVNGFEVRSFTAALLAALVIGLVNSTLGLLLKILTFPFTLLTLGLFLIVINALMLKLSAAITPGFYVRDWNAAIPGAILLALISTLLNWMVNDRKRERT